jgi:hypothetical protein
MAKRKSNKGKQLNKLVLRHRDRIISTFTEMGFDMGDAKERQKAYSIVKRDALDRIEEAAENGRKMSLTAAVNRVMHSKAYMTEQEDVAHRFSQGLKNAGQWAEFRKLTRHQRFDIDKVRMVHGEGKDLEFYYDNSTKRKSKTVHVSIKYVPNVGMTLSMAQE